MGFMLICSRKRFSTNDMARNQNKKIKLDFHNEGSGGNDDLWGQDDDITAEEFDLLEIQATQSCNPNYSLRNNTFQTTNLSSKSSNSVEVHDSKQLQYELEGRIKLLSFSLEKSTKELNEERLNRERLINERIKQFQDREINLKKEVEKMQSILEFKEQEMKSTYSKLQMLRSQLQDKKSNNVDTSMNSNFEDFLKSSKCDEQSLRHDKAFPEKYHRKYSLPVDVSKGEVNGVEILSSILCTRLAIPSFMSKDNIVNSGYQTDSSSCTNLTPVTVLHLKNEQCCDEILGYYHSFLENHVKLLKTLAPKNNPICSDKSSSISVKSKEAFCSQTVVSYLKDIICIYSSPSFKSYPQEISTEHQSPSASIHTQENVTKSPSCVQQNKKITLSDNTIALLQTLSALSNPKIYPVGYHKNEEMEFALSALLSICLLYPKDFLGLIRELPCYFFSNPHESVTGLCTAIKLLIALCPNENFISHLVHKDSNCIFCLIATFLHSAVPIDPEKFAVSFTLIEDFLSSVFTIYKYKEIQLSSSCLPQVVQGIIKSLWKYFEIRKGSILSFEILKKGFLLLHFISSNIPNFKESRIPVDDEYVSLMSEMLAVSKENSEFKEFYDLIHNLWDFQTDQSEFDIDELSEEPHGCTNDTDIE